MVKKSGNFKKPLTNREIQLALIDNFVNMQRVLTNLTIKFEDLSGNMNKMLQLFELSAKSFITKNQNGVPEDKELLGKLDTLLDQNKTIAKGLTLIEEKIRHKIYNEHPTESRIDFTSSSKPRPLPRV